MAIEFEFTASLRIHIVKTLVVTSCSVGGGVPLWPRFKPCSMQVRFMADEITLRHFFLLIIRPASVSNHSTDAPCSLIHLSPSLHIHRTSNRPGIKLCLPISENYTLACDLMCHCIAW